jgi:hypothetical protein
MSCISCSGERQPGIESDGNDIVDPVRRSKLQDVQENG